MIWKCDEAGWKLHLASCMPRCDGAGSALGPVGSSYHAATAPVDPVRLDAAPVNGRFRLEAVRRV